MNRKISGQTPSRPAVEPQDLRADAHVLGSVALLAEAARVEDVDTARRIITGTVVPYGEPGRTNLGLRAVRAGAVAFRDPASPRVIGLYGHDRERTVSRLAEYENTSSGLRARFRVAATPLGDQLLAEASEGVRSMLSIELDGVQYDPASGDIIGGVCEFVAHVPIGAYDSARVDSVAASLHPQQIGDDDVNRRHLARARFGREFITVGGGGMPAAQAAPVAAPAAPVEPVAAPALTATAVMPAAAPPAAPQGFGLDQLVAALVPALVPHLTAGAAPAGLPTGGLTAAPAPAPGLAPSQGPAPDLANPIVQAAQLQAAVARDPQNMELRAALVDITQSGLSLFDNPSTLGEKLWEGASYTRRFVPLFRNLPLTAMKGTGWRWITRPKMQDWSGNKTAIPSNPVSVDQSEWVAERCAAGWDIDRKFRDFGDDQFWTEFYTAQVESYLELSDDRAAAALVEYAIDVTADPATWPTLSDGTTSAYALPQGYSTGTGGLVVTQADVLKAAALATAILEDTPRVRRAPDYIVMNTADWLSLMNLTNLDLPAFLALLKVKPENFQRSALVPKGKIIAGITPAATFRELGKTPIRVEALDVARGGIDSAVFGYTASHMDKPGGILAVPVTEA